MSKQAGSGSSRVMLLVAALLLIAQGVWAQDAVGFVAAVKGKVVAQGGGGERALALKGPIYADDQILTGKRGRIQVVFKDETIVNLGPDADMKVAQYEFKPGAAAFEVVVVQGTVQVKSGAIVRQNPDAFKVSTPTATIGIRGCIGLVAVTPGGAPGAGAGGPVTNVVLVSTGGANVPNPVVVNTPMGSQTITRPMMGVTAPAGSPPSAPYAVDPSTVGQMQGQAGTGGAVADAGEGDDGADEGGDEGETADAGEGEEGEGGDDATADAGDGDDGAAAGDDGTTDGGADGEGDGGDLTATDDFGADDDGGTTTNDPVVSTFDDPVAAATSTVSSTTTDANQTTLSTDAGVYTSTGTAAWSGGFLGFRRLEWSGSSAFNNWWLGVLSDVTGSSDGSKVEGEAKPIEWTTQVRRTYPFDFLLEPTEGSSYNYTYYNYGSRTVQHDIGNGLQSYTFDYELNADNLNEFIYWELESIYPPLPLTNGSNSYTYTELGFIGSPAPAATPTFGSQVAWYNGFQHIIEQFDDGGPQFEGTVGDVDVIANFRNQRVIGFFDDFDESGEGPDHLVFWGAISGNNKVSSLYWNGLNELPGTYDDVAFEGKAVGEAQFYGRDHQGFGAVGDGNIYDSFAGGSAAAEGHWATAAAAHQDYVEAAPTGSTHARGFVAGFADAQGGAGEFRMIGSENMDLTYSLDFEAGTVQGQMNFIGKGTIGASDPGNGVRTLTALRIGGPGIADGVAVSDEAFAARITSSAGSLQTTNWNGASYDTAATQTQPHHALLVPEEPWDQWNEYVTWGEWEVTYVDPGQPGGVPNLIEGYFVAGEQTPQTVVQGLIATNFEGHYSGWAEGIKLYPDGTLQDRSGECYIGINFGSQAILAGSYIDMGGDVLDLVAGGSVTASGFNTTIQGAEAGSEVQGAYFGPNAEAIGGRFSARIYESPSTVGYTGVFGAELGAPPPIN